MNSLLLILQYHVEYFVNRQQLTSEISNWCRGAETNSPFRLWHLKLLTMFALDRSCPILRQLTVHNFISTFLLSILILSSHLRLHMSIDLFASGFPNKIPKNFTSLIRVLHSHPLSSSAENIQPMSEALCDISQRCDASTPPNIRDGRPPHIGCSCVLFFSINQQQPSIRLQLLLHPKSIRPSFKKLYLSVSRNFDLVELVRQATT